MNAETRARNILGWRVRSTPPEGKTIITDFRDVVAARLYVNTRPILDTVTIEPLYEIIGGNREE